jgi:hypothetical protein
MRGALFIALLFACLAGTASAREDIKAEIMSQPNAPIKVVGCSAERYTPARGINVVVADVNNVIERASFESVGPRTATKVRIGFAFFDEMGGRSIHSGIASGRFSPGARIDVAPFGGHIGAVDSLVCFAVQAEFDDGTTWTLSKLPISRHAGGVRQPSANPETTTSSSLAAEILPQSGSPVRLDRCSEAPKNGLMPLALALTNLSEKPVRSVDVALVAYDAKRSPFVSHEVLRGEYAAGAQFTHVTVLEVPNGPFVKSYCTVGIVEFADGTTWKAEKGFLKAATPP